MDKALNMLGLCARAGKLAYGADAAADAVRKGRASVVVMDAGAGPNTRKLLTNACASHGARLFEAADVGRSTGKDSRMAVAVLDARLAARVAELFDQENG